MLSTLMLVGLGFFSASLVAVLIVPWVWRRAVKVTGRRLQFAAPDSVIEVQADRDQLRAEHALSTRKLELRLQDVKDKLAEQAVEHSQNVRLTEQLQEELGRKIAEIEKRDTEIEQMRASMSPIETELASRTSTVQQLRETVRKLEDKVREQETMITQTVAAAGLSDAETEALREASRQADAGKILLPGLDSTRETLTEQVTELTRLAQEMEIQCQRIFDKQENVEKQRGEIANSKTISAQEAKLYQSQISALEAERGKLDADLKDATAPRRGAAPGHFRARRRLAEQGQSLRRTEVTQSKRWPQKSSGFPRRLNRESIVKSVLAALPGGKSAAKRQEPFALPPVAIVPDPEPQAARPDEAQATQADETGDPSPKPASEVPALATAAPEATPPVPVAPEPASTPEPAPAAAQEAKAEPEVVRLPDTAPAPAAKSAPSPADQPAAEPPALEPAKKAAKTRTRRVRSLAERIRALQEEMS